MTGGVHTGGVHLAIVGGGWSATSLLRHLAGERADGRGPGRITVFERGDERPGGGTAYACGTDPGLLMNDDVERLDETGAGFGAWLSAHRDDWIGALADSARDGNRCVGSWLRRHAATLRDGCWNTLFLPRVMFGDFARYVFGDAVRRLAADGVRCVVSRTSVGRLDPVPGGGWRLIPATGAPVHADVVVLATGSPTGTPLPALPVGRRLLPREPLGSRALAVALRNAIGPRGGGRLLIAGSSAAGVELLHALQGTDPGTPLPRVTVVSGTGRLPDGEASGRPGVPVFPGLEQSRHEGALAADELLAIVAADIATARADGWTALDITGPLKAAYKPHVARLPSTEEERFAACSGPVLRMLLRRTSVDYARSVALLKRRCRVEVVAGRVTGLRTGSGGGGPGVAIRPAGDSERLLHPDAVADCRGVASLAHTTGRLPAALLADGVVKETGSGRGIRVDDEMRAAPGLYVLGPLLDGNVICGRPVGHVENAGRIHRLSVTLARQLGGRDHPQVRDRY